MSQQLGKTILSNTIWVGLGFGVRLLIQFVYFILVTRALGPKEYGEFMAVLALVTILSPFSGLGSGFILIKNISRNPKMHSTYWGYSVATTLITGSLLTLIVGFVSLLLFGWTRVIHIALPIAIGDLIGTKLTDISVNAFQAFEKLIFSSLLWIIFSTLRLLGGILLFLSPQFSSAENWAVIYMVTGLLSGVLSYKLACYKLGFGKLNLIPLKGEWREGLYFSINLFSHGAYNDVDKIILSKFHGDVQTGLYTAAYRIFDSILIPTKALLFSTFPGFFRVGTRGILATKSWAIKIAPWLFFTSTLGFFGLIVLTFLVPILLGEKFAPTSKITILLAPIIFLRGFNYIAADSLTGAGFQGIRTLIQSIVSLVNFFLNLSLIPKMGWMGAIYSLWISDILFLFMLNGIILRLQRKYA